MKEVSDSLDQITLVSVDRSDINDEDIATSGEHSKQVRCINIYMYTIRCHAGNAFLQAEFLLHLRLSERFPSEGPCIDRCDLPETLTFEWNPKTSSLADVFQLFEERVEEFRPVRRLLQEIDERTWVLDPECPTHKDLYRLVDLDASNRQTFKVLTAKAQLIFSYN